MTASRGDRHLAVDAHVNPRVDRRLAELGWRSYAAAPLVVQSSVIGSANRAQAVSRYLRLLGMKGP